VTERLCVRLDKTWEKYIRRRRVPPAEIYSSISQVLHVAYVDEIERLSTGAGSAFGGREIGGVGVLSDPWFERLAESRGETVLELRFQMRGLETITTAAQPTSNGRGPLKGFWYSFGFRVPSALALRRVTQLPIRCTFVISPGESVHETHLHSICPTQPTATPVGIDISDPPL
jgi:hypothetical protein